ncbi:hypothetical protein KEM52_002198 [Ascosphaera acerosa]|nr:hypothetical protein KEM52_002198 [Ascosphaera acerosa]
MARQPDARLSSAAARGARARAQFPTPASLPNTLRIRSSTPALQKYFRRLSRSSLIELVLVWLSDDHVSWTSPWLAGGDADTDADEKTLQIDATYPPARSVARLRQLYEDMLDTKGGKGEVIDRVLEGDWRHGICTGQLAMLDMRYIEEHPNGALKWTAFKVEEAVRMPAHTRQHQPTTSDKHSPASVSGSTAMLPAIPRIHVATFLQALQQEISGLVKAHFHVYRSSTLPLTYVRIFVTSTPFNVPRSESGYAYLDSARTVYIAFPDGAPFLYTSFASAPSSATIAGASSTAGLSSRRKSRGEAPALLGTDPGTLRMLVRDALPKALSCRQHRYKVSDSGLTTKNIVTLLALRGSGRTNDANGRYSAFADGTLEGAPLDMRLSRSGTPVGADSLEEVGAEGIAGQTDEMASNSAEQKTAKRRRLLVRQRFGVSGQQQHQKLDTSANGRTAGPGLGLPTPPATSELSGTETASTLLAHHRPVFERFEVHLQDPIVAQNSTMAFSDEEEDDDDSDDGGKPVPATVSLTFTGSDVFAGLRMLTERGIIDAVRMPSYLTGEAATSRVVVNKGQPIVSHRRRKG